MFWLYLRKKMKKLLEIFAKVVILCTVILSLGFSLTTFPVSAEIYKQDIQSNQKPKLKQNSEVTTSSKKQKLGEKKTSEVQSPQPPVKPEAKMTIVEPEPEVKMTINPELRKEGRGSGACTSGITYPHYHSASGEIIRIEDK